MQPTDPPPVLLTLPPRWPRDADPGAGVLARARPPAARATRRPEVVLRLGSTDDSRLQALAVDDEDAFDLDGRPVRYRRYVHRGPDGELVTEEWSWRFDDPHADDEPVEVTLTASVDPADYETWCDVFEAIAATVAPAPRE